MTKEKILIVGGGFAGAKAALDLSEDERFDITLLSDKKIFTYFPTLYHVATGGDKSNASIPLNSLTESKNIKLHFGKAVKLDRQSKRIITAEGESYSYDSLILALGVVTNYFNIKGLQELSFGVKSIEDVEKLKAHLHEQLISEHKPDLNYVIVGGGPTGIELAGALPEYLRQVMLQHKIENRSVHIDLVESAPRLLARMPRDTSRMVQRRLRRLGVKLYLGKRVQGETANDLMVDNKLIQSHTVIWTAGTANNPFFSENGFTLSSNHKVATDIYLQAEPNIFVIGDNANTPYSGMAQTAVHDGEYLAENLKRRTSGKKLKSYMAKAPITIIPVGEGWAAVNYGVFRTYGMLGWVLRQAADAVAFHDYEPWAKAGRQWLTTNNVEESCPVCAARQAAI